MNLIEDLLAKADAYCKRTGIPKSTLAHRVAKDSKFFDRIARGKTTTVRMYERFMAFFADEDAKLAAANQNGGGGEAVDIGTADADRRPPVAA